jgi:hypothetical protein
MPRRWVRSIQEPTRVPTNRGSEQCQNKPSASFASPPGTSHRKGKHMRIQGVSLEFEPKNPCPVCGVETALAEVEPHPLHVNFEIHGYLCQQCGPIKSLVVRSARRRKRH